MPFKKTSTLVYLIIFAFKLLHVTAQNTSSSSAAVKATVVITFDQAPTSLQISKAKVKYNKEFAYSFTLDDGLVSAYSNVFPILKGGRKAANDVYYNGFSYTDGCGHLIPFKAGIAWNSANSTGEDLHTDNSTGYMSWAQLDELYEAGWDVLNHSFSHKTRGYNALGLPNPSLTDQIYDQEISANVDRVAQMTKNKIEMTHLVVPSGDNGYYKRAFVNDMKAVYDQNWQILGQGAGLAVEDPLDYKDFIMNRNILANDLNTANALLNLTASTVLNETKSYWVNSFTHDVETNASSGGTDIDMLVKHMTYIEKTYGSKGNDQMWMAPLQEVFEYLQCRDRTAMTWRQDGNKVYVELDLSTLPTELRRAALTLSIVSDKPFSKVEVAEMPGLSFNGTSTNQKIVNLEFASYLKKLKELNAGNGGGVTFMANEAIAAVHTEVYPNPAEDTIFIRSSVLGNKSVLITVLDVQGTEIIHQKTQAQDGLVALAIQKLTPGSYTLRVKSGQVYLKDTKFSKQP